MRAQLLVRLSNKLQAAFFLFRKLLEDGPPLGLVDLIGAVAKEFVEASFCVHARLQGLGRAGRAHHLPHLLPPLGEEALQTLVIELQRGRFVVQPEAPVPQSVKLGL